MRYSSQRWVGPKPQPQKGGIMSKISYLEYQQMFLNDEVRDEEILAFSQVVKGEGGFDWELAPDPDKVEISAQDIEDESAMKIGNALCRFRRARRFKKRKKAGVDLPVLVSEGDSWFQFPFLIKEVIDHLEDQYLIWSVGAAGDTASNMVFSAEKKGRTEYMRALRRQKSDVQGFLFSAAGNDIIGEDPETGKAALFNILKPYNGNDQDVVGHIDHAVLGERVSVLKMAYERVIGNIRTEPGIERLPVFIHGYDYAFPFPIGDDDPRNPSYAKNDEWLGEPLSARNIHDGDLRRSIIGFLIDTVYDMLKGLAGDSEDTRVWVVDCRGAMPSVSDWNDEIHGTSDGFAKVARRFGQVVGHALGTT